MKIHNIPVAVTGLGIVSSIGHDVNTFTHALKKGNSRIGVLEHMKEKLTFQPIGAEIQGFNFQSVIKSLCTDVETRNKIIKSVRQGGNSIQVCIVAAMEAFLQSGIEKSSIPNSRRGIVVAGNNITCDLQYNMYRKFYKSPEYVTPSYVMNYMDTNHVGVLSDIFNIHGEGFTVGGASCSGNVALIKGMQLIQMGLVDSCMVIGAVTDLSPVEFQGYYNLGALGGKKFANAPQKACRPFDQDHEGFIYGQAGSCIMLESIESAVKRNQNVLARLTGGSMILHGSRLPEPRVESEVMVMRNALMNAGRRIEEVDYLNAHATSTPLGDRTELSAIKEVAGKHIANMWLNSTKSLTGHCLYSAGVVEAIATIVQMKESFVHPNLNLECPIDNGFKFCGQKSEASDLKVAMSNAFGFGGINTSLIIERGID